MHERDVPVPMRDGVELLTDSWWPRARPHAPTVLVRSPYGRRGGMGFLYGRLLAHQGFRVVVQSCRGTDGSGGEFGEGFEHEPADGQATLEWLRAQPWFTGELATMGASYLGYVQWALIFQEPPPELKTMIVQVAPTAAREFAYSGGAMSYEITLSWAQLMTSGASLVDRMLHARRHAKALHTSAGTLPLSKGYLLATGGRRAPFFEDWLAHDDPDDGWWSRSDYSVALRRVDVPVLLQGAWYDLYAAQTVAQYRALRERGADAHLTMFATTHRGLIREWPSVLPEAVAWLRAMFEGAAPPPRRRVRVQLIGRKEWRDLRDWPPDAAPVRLHLQPGGGLSGDAPPASEPDRFRYDPTDPTPSVGGAVLGPHAGPKDNRELEARRDVLTYTTGPLERGLEVLGPVSAELWFSSSRQDADVFVRLCRVTPDGRSTNVCDTIQRLRPGRPPAGDDGVGRLWLELPPTACRFDAGDRIRLQVSSGAHPRFARNTGSGEPLASATRLVAADQAVYHDPDRPSSVLLRASRDGAR